MFENLSLRAKILIGNAICLLFLISLGLVSLNSIHQLNETDKWVDHTHRVINKSLQLESTAINMETGMRGFLLAGQEQFLEPYNTGKRDFSININDLRETVSDNPAQVSLLNDMESTIQDWQKYVTEDAIALRDDIGDAKTMNDLSALIAQAKGKTYFDRFRVMLNTFITRERNLLSLRHQTLNETQNVDEIRTSIDSVSHTYQVIEQALLISAAATDMETGMRGYLLAGKETFLTPYINGKNKISSLFTTLENKLSDNPTQFMLLAEMDAIINEWLINVAEPQIELRREIGNAKTMDDISDLVAESQGKRYFDKFRSQLSTFSERENSLMVTRMATSSATVSNTNIIIIVGIILATLVSIPVAFILSNSIMQPFQNIFKGLKCFSSNELKNISSTFNNVVQRMSQSAERVGVVANTIDSLSQNLSQISNQQASAIEETSASAEEISGMVNVNVQLAEESRNLSKQVGDKMTQLDDAMEKISESNHQISELAKIIAEIGAKTQIIDDIVFQTKLLSFNASVEAERAGEHGRGFAVVAQEVGNLAQMSGKAAMDISAIVKQSILEAETIAKENTNRVIHGSAIVAETKQQSNVVLDGASKIFEASNEQARGIQEISNAVESINKATQHAASISDQASNSSSELTQQAETLNHMVRNLNGFLGGHNTQGYDKQRNRINNTLRDEYQQQSYQSAMGDFDISNNMIDEENNSNDTTKNNKIAWERL